MQKQTREYWDPTAQQSSFFMAHMGQGHPKAEVRILKFIRLWQSLDCLPITQ